MSVRHFGTALTLVAATIALSAAAGNPSKTGKTIVVKMIDKSATEYLFEPSTIVAATGDVVRFEQTATMPHNVDFKEAPAGAALGESKTSPMMMTPGQAFEVTIDKRFPKGLYRIICIPHESMGMKGTITVK